MEKPIILLGAGGHAKVLLDALLKMNKKVIGIVDKQTTKTLLNLPILGTDEKIEQFAPNSVQLVNGIGSIANTEKRTQIYNKFIKQGYKFANVIHPSVILANEIRLGQGIQIMAGAVIQVGSDIGDNSIINTQASIDHDCVIGKHVHIAPGVLLSGEVKIGDGSHIGTGTTIIQGIKIGTNALVGAGSVVVKNVANNKKVMGVPAK